MIKIGIIGCGFMGGMHFACYQALGVQVTAVADPRRAFAEQIAGKCGARIYETGMELIEQADVTAVDICLPTDLHIRHAVAAMRKGLDVFVEKPVCMLDSEMEGLRKAKSETGRQVQVGQVLRFWPEYVALKDAIDSGKYGRLLSGSMSRLGNTPGWSWENWMRDPARSGLVPYDLHIHDLDFLVYAMGKPMNTVCHRARGETQDYFSVVYEYPGCFINAEAAWYDCDYPFQAAYRFQFERALMEYRGGKLTVHLAGGGVETLQEAAGGADNGIKVGAPYVEGASVTAKVVKNGKAKKITVMTYKPKKNEKRKLGHRQPYTKLEITAINA